MRTNRRLGNSAVLFGGLQLPDPVHHVRRVNRPPQVLNTPDVDAAVQFHETDADFPSHEPEITSRDVPCARELRLAGQTGLEVSANVERPDAAVVVGGI